MAEEVVAGPVRDWLAANRASLNARFRLAAGRHPQLAADAVLALCRELLPPLAAAEAGSSAELFAAIFDLILLHAGRGKLAPGGGEPGLVTLFRETFPRLRPILAKKPQSLPAALSNSVENLAQCGSEFARELGLLAGSIHEPDELLDAGAVLAWRLGDARLRPAAFDRMSRLRPQVILAVLGVVDWPAASAALVVAGLKSHGWWRPQELWSPKTLASLSDSPEQQSALLQQLNETADGGARGLCGRMGDFSGYGGHFDEPPVLLDELGRPDMHRFWVKCGADTFCIDGDVFGWACQAAPDTNFLPCPVKAPGWRPPANTTSTIARDGLVAFTSADSFRVRVAGPQRKPL